MRIIIAGFLGAVVLFIWGFISWEVLPWNAQTMHKLSNEDAVMAVIKAGNPESGTYSIPGMGDAKDEASKNAHMEKMKTGPTAMIEYSTTGMDLPIYMLRGFIIYLLSAMIAASLLGKLSWSLASKFSARVRFVMMIGIFLAIAGTFGDWAWYGTSMSFTLANALNTVIGWTLAGMVIAWRMKPLMAKSA
jgi:hypothetical protein